MKSSANKTLVVIGGGAAGFFCAINAAQLHPSLRVVILEKSSKLLSKVKISGGGRCNVTHQCSSIAQMIKYYPRGANFLKKAFQYFFVPDTIAWFKQRAVPLVAEADGRMFPTANTSDAIIQCFFQEASRHGVEIKMNCDVQQIISPQSKTQAFELMLSNGKKMNADYLCIACGGFPKASQFNWLLSTGHTIVPPVPSLFTFNIPNTTITHLMGLSVPEVVIKIIGTKLQQQGPLLITHWGFSGPAVLKLSALAAIELAAMQYQYQVQVNWLPQYHEGTMIEKLKALRFELAPQKMVNRNPFGLPARLWEYLLTESGINLEIRWADVPAREQNKLAKLLCAQEFSVKGKTTFKEEFVTAGGISLSEVNAQTMESKMIPGLFFAGEILNIDAVTGGFNFQNAWTTGMIAARHMKP